MEIRNTSPLGDLDVTLLGRVVMAGEVIDVTEEQAVELCSALASFAPVTGEDLAAVLLGRGDDFTRTYLAECAQVSVEELLAAPAEVLAAGRTREVFTTPIDMAEKPADGLATGGVVDIPAEGLVVGDTDFVLPADALPANDAAAEEPTKTKTRRGAAADDTKEA